VGQPRHLSPPITGGINEHVHPERTHLSLHPPATDAAGLTTTYGETVRGTGFGVARERNDPLGYIGLIEALKVSARAERSDALVAAGVMPAGVRL
jgi:hypothetical protein